MPLLRLLHPPLYAVPDGLRTEDFAGFFAGAVRPILPARVGKGRQSDFGSFLSTLRRPRLGVGGFRSYDSGRG